MNIIVVGGGLAGLVATLRAVELGARTTLLEKGDRLGGSFVYSSGYVWSYKDLRTFRREAPGGDIALQKVILERFKPGLEWLEAFGAPVLARETGNPLTLALVSIRNGRWRRWRSTLPLPAERYSCALR